jgi:hypothetical protein
VLQSFERSALDMIPLGERRFAKHTRRRVIVNSPPVDEAVPG